MKRRDVLAAFGSAATLPLAACHREPPAVTGGFAGPSPERGHLLRTPSSAPMGPVRRTQVVIAGGGVAGLAAARALRLAGIEDYVLLEAQDESGGNSTGTALAGLRCPLGAHYLPVPGPNAPHVQDLMEEVGLRRRVAGRWAWDERHLCHSPQERLFFRGQWQEGLLPVQDVPVSTIAQYVLFSRAVEAAGLQAGFPLPVAGSRLAPSHAALDAVPFARWLDQNELRDEHLRWYLDYCCRDDYGAGVNAVSAWAGLHYFASRHGFQAPGAETGERDKVLTWPEGNAWLARRLAWPAGERVRTGRLVLRVQALRTGMQVDALDPATRTVERWEAEHVVVALPAFVAARVVASAPGFVAQAARETRYAPWVVVNLQLREPLLDRGGAAPSWDNVLHGAAGLGYVDASHQKLDPRPGPTVLTWYFAPGPAARAELLAQPWTHWRDRALADLAPAHPDLADKLEHVAVARYGHAMAIPVPGTRARLAAPPLRGKRLSFAHADWAGYSVFEEAFTLGHLAGAWAAQQQGVRAGLT